MSQSARGSLSLEQFIALNDEILALVRAGVPLESSLAGLGGDLSGRLGDVTARLSADMARGRSLAAAVEAASESFPPIYRAVVRAGMRAGRLPAALEGFSGVARRLVEVRRSVTMALVYPLVVLLLAWGLFVLLLTQVLPTLPPLFDNRPPALLRWLVALGPSAAWWGPVLPVVVLTMLGVWLVQTRRAWALADSRSGKLLTAFPGMAGLVRDSRAASLADLLALLLLHGVPLDEALTLSAEAVGDRKMFAAARELAVRVRQGSPRPSLAARGALPPLVEWLLSAGQAGPTLIGLLRGTAESYRRRALRRADWLRLVLPLVLTAVVGGGATLLYVLSIWGPMTKMLIHLGNFAP